MKKVTVGGKECNVALKYSDLRVIFARYSIYLKIYERKQKQGKFYNWDYFVFKTLWIALDKSGVWPFRKPFRSFRKMCRSLYAEEYAAITIIVMDILGIKHDEPEDKETKNA